MDKIIKDYLKSSSETIQSISENPPAEIKLICETLINALKNNNKILIFGNGGSAADAQHFVAELVGRFKKERKGFPAIALTTNSSILTALANDYEYDIVFKRQIEALGCPDDVAIGISTSGQAKNVINALKKAREAKMHTIALSGAKGTNLKEISDIALLVNSKDTPHIQEAHITIIHLICKIVEDALSI